MEVTWQAALARYRLPRQLATRARRAPFGVITSGEALIITPGTGRPRRVTEGQFDRSISLIDRAGRGQLVQATFSSSYIPIVAPGEMVTRAISRVLRDGRAAAPLLATTSTIYVHLTPVWPHYAKVVLYQVLAGDDFHSGDHLRKPVDLRIQGAANNWA